MASKLTRRFQGLFLLPTTVALMLLPPSAHAAHPLVCDDTGTVGGGAAEIEVSATAAGAARADESPALGVGLSLHLGMLREFDVGLSLAYEAPMGADGERTLADPVLDAKLRIVEQRGLLPALAVRVDYKAPQDRDGFGSGHGLGAFGLASWNVGGVALHANLGTSAHVGAGDGYGSLIAGAAAALDLGAGVTAGAEVVWDGHLGGDDSPLWGGIALQWTTAGSGTLSAGVGATLAAGGWASAATVGWTGAFGG